MIHTGVLTVTGDRAGWRVRELVLIGGSVAAAVVTMATGLHRVAAAQRRRRVALALAGAGTAWSLLSIVDMHLTSLIPESLVDPLTARPRRVRFLPRPARRHRRPRRPSG